MKLHRRLSGESTAASKANYTLACCSRSRRAGRRPTSLLAGRTLRTALGVDVLVVIQCALPDGLFLLWRDLLHTAGVEF